MVLVMRRSAEAEVVDGWVLPAAPEVGEASVAAAIAEACQCAESGWRERACDVLDSSQRSGQLALALQALSPMASGLKEEAQPTIGGKVFTFIRGVERVGTIVEDDASPRPYK